MAPSGEQALIRWLRQRVRSHLQVLVGPGDDAAALRLAPGRLCLWTADLMMEGVDFDLKQAGARRVGRKALAISLSDLAGMAGRPVAALVSLALPRAGGGQLAQELLAGIQELADEFHVALAGGDTNSWDGPLVVGSTVLGEATPKGPVLRSGARPDDWILVTGSFGGSLAGKHLDFQPRVREALLLHDRYELHAMIDVSDGLSTDLHHILEESRCGAVLRVEAIPISDTARSMAAAPASEAVRQGVGESARPQGGRVGSAHRGVGEDGGAMGGAHPTALEHALHDGEDFELLFTVAPDEARRMLAEQPLDVPLAHIGEIVAEAGAWLVDAAGQRTPLAAGGWEHRFAAD